MSTSPDSKDDLAELSEQVAFVLEAQGMGRSLALERLLRFLHACALEGRAPKELEIADAVFDRGSNEPITDASARVYVHRLRRKLEEFYADKGRDQVRRLILPRGGYMLTLSPLPDSEASPTPIAKRRFLAPRFAVGLASLAILGAGLGAGWFLGGRSQDPTGIGRIQNTAVWRSIHDAGHREAIVLGDYYIFGERGSDGSIIRMRREFEVNSANDLDMLKAMSDGKADNYVDLGLTYLPVGVGAAIRSVAPVLEAGPRGTSAVPVVPSSVAMGQMVQSTSLIYLGYLSGLGPLRSPMFEGSRFRVGDSYDEVVDTSNGHHYEASSHLEDTDTPGEDYAIISSFLGLGGNRILVIAGTRDAALMAAADFVTRPASLAQLEPFAVNGSSFEALIGISALHNVGLDAKLIAATKRNNPSWSNKDHENFPDDIKSVPMMKNGK